MSNFSEEQSSPLVILPATAADLEAVSAVIASAVDAWPVSERLKRSVLPVLSYDEVDLSDHELLVAKRGADLIAMGAWQFETPLSDPDGQTSALMHGLFVASGEQGSGIGQRLQAAVAARASVAGFHGLHVRAERFAVSYFERCGYRRLRPDQQPKGSGPAYPYWFWHACDRLASGR